MDEKAITNEMINGMVYEQITTNQAKHNINEHTKRKITFPDGNIIIIEGITDLENIFATRKKISKYISYLDFEGLKNIKRHSISYYRNIFGKWDKEVPDSDLDYDKIIGSLKNKLSQNRFQMDGPPFENIINEFVCDFLSLDYSVFANYHENQQENNSAHRDTVTDVTSDIDAIKIDTSGNKELKTQKTESDSLESIENNITLFGESIYKGKSNILYAEPKVGKSYFSIEVAKSENIKKPLFIMLEDFSGVQFKRYESNLNDKEFELLNLQDFDTIYTKSLDKRKQEANYEILLQNRFPQYHRIKILTRQTYVDYGIIKSKNDKLDRISVIENILAKAIDSGHDFICIDSLHALIEGNGRSFGRSEIGRIIEPVSKSRITFLMLHHTTKKKDEMALTQELRNIFDNVYKLENISNSEDSSELKLIEENARDNIPHIINIKRTVSNNYIVQHQIIGSNINNNSNDKNRKNVKAMIMDIISNHPTDNIEYESLCSALNKKAGRKLDEANIKKILKELDKQGYIMKKDGSTYVGGIIILKRK